jgi:hypothetical protein
MSRTERSRSPHVELSLALPASSSGPLPRSFDLDKMELTLGGHVVPGTHPQLPFGLGLRELSMVRLDRVRPHIAVEARGEDFGS